ncbi:MAG: phosphate ABC transporter permease PstA [Propionibacteriales bacterium]|nr:phosphate ABC transporter permease PstA [Propionibacteriales bacterium]
MTTHLPVLDPDAAPAVPRPAVGSPNADELFVRIGAWAAAVAVAWLITQRFLPLAGIPWFLIVFFAAGVVMTALLTTMTSTWVEVKDRVASAVITGAALVVGAALVSTVAFVFLRGWRALVHTNFLFDDMAGVDPKAAFTEGGVAHAITGSLIQLGIALVVTLPLGIGTAVFMTEVGGRFGKVVRTIVEAMTALPSIVAGLFIYAVLILTLGFPPSGFAASMAISVMMLPIIARAADVVLRVVPGTLREASLALGASRWRTVWHVVLPTARPGLATAVILGVARGVGETSPVLLTSGAANFMVTNPVGGAMNSLPLYIYNGARSGEPQLIDRAFGAAAILMILVLALFVIARLVARPAGARNRPRLTRRVVGGVRALARLASSLGSRGRRTASAAAPAAPPPPLAARSNT